MNTPQTPSSWILSPEDEAHILSAHRHAASDSKRERVENTEMMVTRFTRALPGVPSKYIHYAYRILDALADENFDGPRVCSYTTLEEIRTDWESQVRKAWDYHVEKIAKHGVPVRVPAMDPDEHPWGEDLVFLCDWWLRQTPYRVWCFARDLGSYAQLHMQDAVLDFAHPVAPSSGYHMGQAIRKRFQALCRKEVGRYAGEYAPPASPKETV